jgi:hypothetical protein
VRFYTQLFYLLLLVIYFDYLPNRFVTKSNAPLTVSMHSKIKDANYQKNLKVRPTSKNTLIYVYDVTSEKWVNQNDRWSQMPDFAKEFTLKPLFSSGYFELGFEVLDVKTGKIYKTPQKKIWGLALPRALLSSIKTLSLEE